MSSPRNSFNSGVRESFGSLSGAPPPKPPSLPNNWPNPSEADLNERPTRNISIKSEQAYLFNDNFIKTSKFTKWSFVPKFLSMCFNPKKKMANVYFLIIAGMQTIPLITNTYSIPTVLMPLSFVVFVDGIFAALEDHARHIADARANGSKTRVFNNSSGEMEEKEWANINVGEFIQIRNREVIPADVIIITAKEKSDTAEGRAYVETKSLDGETNLKMRRALKSTLNATTMSLDGLKFIEGEVEMEHPNKLIDSFKGTIKVVGKEKEVIDTTNVLLRGCTLRNVDWVIGLAVNTGIDTKIMMSNTTAPNKVSSLEQRISTEIKRVVLYLLAVCLLGAVGAIVWDLKKMEDAYYLKWR